MTETPNEVAKEMLQHLLNALRDGGKVVDGFTLSTEFEARLIHANGAQTGAHVITLNMTIRNTKETTR